MKFADAVREEGRRVQSDDSAVLKQKFGIERRSVRAKAEDAPLVEVVSWGRRKLRYRVMEVIVWDGVLVLYGYRVRRDGVSFGREVPVSGNLKEVRSL